MFDALAKGSDPDRMKGALYVLYSKGTGKLFDFTLVDLPLTLLQPPMRFLVWFGPFTLKKLVSHVHPDHTFRDRYLMSLLECQHQEKVSPSVVLTSLADAHNLYVMQPSIQKLVANLGQEALVHLAEEVINTDTYMEETPGVDMAIQGLEEQFSASVVDQALTKEALAKSVERSRKRAETDRRTVRIILNRLKGAQLDLPLL
jgi:proteasome activator subunit 4